MFSLLIKSLLGAFIVVIIALFSKSKNYYIAGLIPLFPTFALISHYIVFKDNGVEELRMTAIFGILSLLPYFLYLLSVIYFSTIFSMNKTLLVATSVWFGFAFLIIILWEKFLINLIN